MKKSIFDCVTQNNYAAQILGMASSTRKQQSREPPSSTRGSYSYSSNRMGNANSTKAHFDTAAKTGTLSLNNSGLSKVPEAVQKLQPNLRTLDLGGNKLGKVGIPEWISGFQALKTLLLVRCELTTLPEGIGDLKSLETLNLSSNKLSSIPSQIGQLKKLKTLTLTGNQLNSLPSTLAECKNLEMLDISENKLTTLPESIGKLNVIELNANMNRLSDVPSTLHSCPRLKTLRLDENCLGLSENLLLVLSSSQVSLILLNGNVFTQKQLEDLDQFQAYMERFTATKKKIF